MEDHMISCRLAVTAAFCRNMRNFPVDPPREPAHNAVTVYHAQPVGGWDYLGREIVPDFFVDIADVLDEKVTMLAEHKSQKDWLDKSQGLDAYLETARENARKLGAMSGSLAYAEGSRRHHPLGLCEPGADPLCDALKERVLPA
jgi:LmbE family N-acetylglucosaminyl deacetylase